MVPDPVIALDIGNTTIAIGRFEGGRMAGIERVPVQRASEFASVWPAHFPPLRDGGATLVACSVNPPALQAVEEALARDGGYTTGVLLVGRELPVRMEVRVREPQRVGADRLVNASEAYARLRRAAIVVDFGTAITADCVSADGAFLGGVIAPGARLQAAALHEHTALLPEVGLDDAPAVLGRDTVGAIRSGIFWGIVGGVRETVERLRREAVPGAAVLATGGDAPRFVPHIPEIEAVVPDLTLSGLYRIFCDARTA